VDKVVKEVPFKTERQESEVPDITPEPLVVLDLPLEWAVLRYQHKPHWVELLEEVAEEV
jgi:hypothetical protein